MAARTVLNTARRFPYTFAPALARAFGVEVSAIAIMLGAVQGVSLLSPLFGSLGDRFGYRKMMVTGLTLLFPLTLLAFSLPFYMLFILAVTASVGKALFDPSIQAYIGHRLPPERHGLGMGIIELAWSAATFLGVPVIGYLMEWWDYRAPFVALGVAGLIFALLLHGRMPVVNEEKEDIERPSLGSILTLIAGNPATKWALGVGFFISMANDGLFVVYGGYLEDNFGLGLSALGLATIAIGASEAAGEGATALFADKIGLRRALGLGCFSSAAAYFLLPFLSSSLYASLFGLAFIFLTFEFSVVVSFSLFIGLLPRARGTFIASYIAAMGLGR
ncbi:MAG: hypothetical protein C0609_11230, partial [Deltaproteobacteria bacterium]